MIEYRFETDVLIDERHTEGLLGGDLGQLVTVELNDGPGVVDLLGRPAPQPPVRCSVRPQEARELAFSLLELAERAERMRPGR